jgi:serine/threonine protein kinase
VEPEPSARSVHIVGRYAVYDAIAAGGMATVHYGRLLGPVGFSRTVAIKRLHSQFARDPEFVSMFLDEARLAARIRHPNVVPTLDVVATDGELFLVMEYVAGESLVRLVRTAAGMGTIVPPRIVLSVMCGVLRGLHAAHEAKNEQGEPLGIVHRDVSPQNVLVGIDGQARVLDFGVAKAAGRLQTTRDGKLKGKLAYMAPEQLRGKTVDRRTDIFAASVVLWEALTGRRLFKGDNEGAIVTKILEGDVIAPSTVIPQGEADPESRAVLQAVDAITLKGLALHPEDRYDTAREMAAALERAAAPAGVSEVSEWVEHFAKDILVTRAQVVADIESNSAVVPPDLAGIRDSGPGGISGIAPVSVPSNPRLSSQDVARPAGPDLSSISAASQIHAQTVPPARDRRTWVVGAIGAAVGLLLFFIVFRALHSDDSAATSVAASSATPFTSPAPPATTTPADPGAPTVAAAPPATAWTPDKLPVAVPVPSPVAPPVAAIKAPAAAAPPAAHPTPHPATPHASPGHATPGGGCDPPFTYDAQGMKHFKPECF